MRTLTRWSRRCSNRSTPLTKHLLAPAANAARSISICRNARSCSRATAPSTAWSCRAGWRRPRLIEEFMILANVAAAETLEKAHSPLIYRVHDEPSVEKVNALREFLATLGIPFPKGGVPRAEDFNRVLERVKGHDAEPLVNEIVLRTQAQAQYAAENYGHFGLNLH